MFPFFTSFDFIAGTCIILGLLRNELKELWNYGADESKDTLVGDEEA